MDKKLFPREWVFIFCVIGLVLTIGIVTWVNHRAIVSAHGVWAADHPPQVEVKKSAAKKRGVAKKNISPKQKTLRKKKT